MRPHFSIGENAGDVVKKADLGKRGNYKKYVYNSAESVPSRTLRHWARQRRLLTRPTLSINEDDSIHEG